MRRTKGNTGFYAFLQGKNLLSGDERTIALARKEYLRMYKAKWRKQQRAKTKQYTISLAPAEVKHIKYIARVHKRSITRFLKEAAFSYADKRYLVPDSEAIGTIRQLLALNYNALLKLFEDNLLPLEAGRMILEQMQTLEQTVLSQLHNPKQSECVDASS